MTGVRQLVVSLLVAAGLFAGSALVTGTVIRQGRPFPDPASIRSSASRDRYQVPVGDSFVQGARSPTVTIVMFVDLFCRSCGEAAIAMERILQAYPEDVALVVKHSPRRTTRATSLEGAILCEIGAQRGRFWDAYQSFMQHVRAGQGPEIALEATRTRLGLSSPELEELRGEPRYSKRIFDDLRLAQRLNARGTPFFFINGRALLGNQPYDVFSGIVEEERRLSLKRISAGVSRSQLYAEIVNSGRQTMVLEASAAAPTR